MKLTPAAFLLLAAPLFAQDSNVRTVFQTELPDIEDREELVLEVTLPPGSDSPPHRHNAHTFVYVLEGTVEMQVAGGELKRLGPGESFYENPDDIHTVSRNVSDSEPAKILVVFIKHIGAPTTVMVESSDADPSRSQPPKPPQLQPR